MYGAYDVWESLIDEWWVWVEVSWSMITSPVCAAAPEDLNLSS